MVKLLLKIDLNIVEFRKIFYFHIFMNAMVTSRGTYMVKH